MGDKRTNARRRGFFLKIMICGPFVYSSFDLAHTRDMTSRSHFVPLGRGRSPRCPKSQARSAVRTPAEPTGRLGEVEILPANNANSREWGRIQKLICHGFIRVDSRHSRARAAWPLMWVFDRRCCAFAAHFVPLGRGRSPRCPKSQARSAVRTPAEPPLHFITCIIE